jgi:hypothetical protein
MITKTYSQNTTMSIRQNEYSCYLKPSSNRIIFPSRTTLRNPRKVSQWDPPFPMLSLKYPTVLRKYTPETDSRDKKLMYYTRYVDNILMIYNAKHTTPKTINNLINKTHPNLQFTPIHEHNNSISFLDLLLI